MSAMASTEQVELALATMGLEVLHVWMRLGHGCA